MSINCRIIKDFVRPSVSLVEKFKDMPIANIDDNMGRIAATRSNIKRVNKGHLLGIAFTVKVPQGDNLMFHAAMDLAKPGDVIVIDAGGFTDRAIFGELMSTYCKSRGIKGLVCDGAIRDRDELAEMENFPIYAISATPNGPYKNGPGEINVPVVIGDKIVHPGDIVVGDGDGVLFIKPDIAEKLAMETEGVERKEADIKKHILEDGTYIRPWVTDLLKKINCEII